MVTHDLSSALLVNRRGRRRHYRIGIAYRSAPLAKHSKESIAEVPQREMRAML